MRALVIGASGFIGLHVVDALLAQGVAVAATCRKATPSLFLRKRKVELLPGSLQEPALLRAAMRGCDAVFLTGAHYPRYSLDREASLAEGVTGIRNACQAALDTGVARFIYTSTIATLAARRGAVADEDDVPIDLPTDSVYRAVKWAMEREVEEACARGLSAVTLLPGGCVGAGDFRLGTGGILVLTVRGQLPFRLEGIVNLVDIEDVARAHVAALNAVGTRYCIAPHNLEFGALLTSIVARYGGRLPPCISAHDAALHADEAERAAAPRKARVPFPRELVDIIAAGGAVSCARAQRELGLRFSALEPAIERAHAFFQRVGYIPRTTEYERTSL